MDNQEAIQTLKKHVSSHIIGQEMLVDRLLIALLADGHLLVEGAPGLAKTKAIKELAEQHRLLDRITVTSSSREVLRALNRLAPEISRGLVAEYNWLDPLKVARQYGCSLLALKWTLCTPERLEKARKQGLHVSVWTVNEPALMRRLADFGVDSLIPDYPGLAVSTLSRS